MQVLDVINGQAIYREATAQELAEFAALQNRLPTKEEYTAEVQSMLDTKVKERGYDNILSACSYAPCTVPPFAAEGQACLSWRGAVWKECNEIMYKVQHGQIPQPTIPELIAMLPTLVWPT